MNNNTRQPLKVDLHERTGYETNFCFSDHSLKMALSEEDIASSLSEPDQATKGFTFQQTMLRVKDPKVSLDFYTRVMGMRFVHCSYFTCIEELWILPPQKSKLVIPPPLLPARKEVKSADTLPASDFIKRFKVWTHLLPQKTSPSALRLPTT